MSQILSTKQKLALLCRFTVVFFSPLSLGNVQAWESICGVYKSCHFREDSDETWLIIGLCCVW